jgi:hypothetical protein
LAGVPATPEDALADVEKFGNLLEVKQRFSCPAS